MPLKIDASPTRTAVLSVPPRLARTVAHICVDCEDAKSKDTGVVRLGVFYGPNPPMLLFPWILTSALARLLQRMM